MRVQIELGPHPG